VANGVFTKNDCLRLSERVMAHINQNHFASISIPDKSVRIEGAAQFFELFGLLRNDAFRNHSTQLLGPNWSLLLNRHNHITIDYGSGLDGIRTHRDSLQWSRPFLSVIIGLAMPSSSHAWPRVIPGSHLWPVGAPPNGGGYWLDEDENSDMRDQQVFVRLAPGDALFLDPLTFHRAGSGFATEPRIVWTVALRASDELAMDRQANEILMCGDHVYAGQEGWIQRNE
jgi:ectoine hydroxylase-related dioxygenase (phytanoyl-CoA dioxygenase family)